MAYISKSDIDSLKILSECIKNEKYNYFKTVIDKVISNVEKTRIKQNQTMVLYQRKKRSDKNE